MKIIFYTLLTSIALIATASAAPKLIVDTVVTDSDGHGNDKVVAHFHVLTKNGKEAVMPVGKNRYAVTPVLHGDRSVDAVVYYSHPNQNGNISRLGPYKQTSSLGERRNISFGMVTYATKVSAAK